jgi:hypothetical protein
MNRIAFTFFGRQMNDGFGQGVPRVRGFSAEGETVPSLVERSAQSCEAFSIKVFASGFSHRRLPPPSVAGRVLWIESAKPSVW